MVQTFIFSFALICFMSCATAGLLEAQVKLLLGESAALVKRNQEEVCAYMRQLCDARLIQILPVEDKPEGEWPLVMSLALAKAVTPSRESLPEVDRDAEEKTNKPDYCSKITPKDLVTLLGARKTFKPWIVQRSKIYRIIDSVICEYEKKQSCSCQKYGSEAIRDYLIEKVGSRTNIFPGHGIE